MPRLIAPIKPDADNAIQNRRQATIIYHIMSESKPDNRFQYIDCHLHLQDSRLSSHLAEIMQRARQVGVCRFVCNGTSEEDWAAVANLARQYEEVIPCFGLHPWFVSERSSNWKETLTTYLKENQSGVGEIGLDHWLEPRDEADQVKVFTEQLELARDFNRPVTIHCLKAWDLLLEVLRMQEPLPCGFPPARIRRSGRNHSGAGRDGGLLFFRRKYIGATSEPDQKNRLGNTTEQITERNRRSGHARSAGIVDI